jgi:precorrin-2/cobalt-factor-2 C20-methyltransferase
MKGKLIGVGVGPGDPELLTLKAVKALDRVGVICAPKSRKSKPSIALSIVQNHLKNRERDYEVLEPLFPMVEDIKTLEECWEKTTVLIQQKLKEGLDVAFITIGDPSVYSTFSYISKRIASLNYEIEIIPGVTSFTSCAASAKISLAEKDEILVIVPKIDDNLNQILEYADTLVLMKTSRHTNLLKDLIDQDKRDKKIISIQKCSMGDEKVFEGFLDNKDYLSTTIVKFKNKH